MKLFRGAGELPSTVAEQIHNDTTAAAGNSQSWTAPGQNRDKPGLESLLLTEKHCCCIAGLNSHWARWSYDLKPLRMMKTCDSCGCWTLTKSCHTIVISSILVCTSPRISFLSSALSGYLNVLVWKLHEIRAQLLILTKNNTSSQPVVHQIIWLWGINSN